METDLYLEKLRKEDELYFESQEWRKEGYTCFGKRERSIFFKETKLRIQRYYYYDRCQRKGFFYLDQHYDWEANLHAVSEEGRNKIVQLYGKVPATTIAKQFGVATMTIYNILKEKGVKMTGKRLRKRRYQRCQSIKKEP